MVKVSGEVGLNFNRIENYFMAYTGVDIFFTCASADKEVAK